MIPPRFLKFCLVGASGVIVNTVILFCLKEFINAPLITASFVAIECAILSNFLLNNHWTFDTQSGSPYYRFAKFNVVCLLGLGINMAILVMLTNVGLYYLIANLVGILAATGWNYLSSRLFVWNNNEKKE